MPGMLFFIKGRI